jgi:hypothetical protein
VIDEVGLAPHRGAASRFFGRALKVICPQDARELLTDVATAHSDAADASQTPERHRAVAAIVQRILDGKDGVRH